MHLFYEILLVVVYFIPTLVCLNNDYLCVCNLNYCLCGWT